MIALYPFLGFGRKHPHRRLTSRFARPTEALRATGYRPSITLNLVSNLKLYQRKISEPDCF